MDDVTMAKVNNSIASQLSLEDASDIKDAMEKLGRLTDDKLGKFVDIGILGDNYNGFYNALDNAITEKLIATWNSNRDTLDSWYFKVVTIIVVGPGDQTQRIRGELWRGKDYKEEERHFIVACGDKMIEFDMTQVASVSGDPERGRFVILDSPHCGVGLPKIVDRWLVTESK